MENPKQRLSKVMAAAGVASRRSCEEIIFAGRVKVNNSVVLIPQTMVSQRDSIAVDNEPICATAQEKVYYMVNKPAGYICSSKGGEKSKLVVDLFEGIEQRLFTVGRLDKDTEGLLLVTNDGHFANQVIHPSSNLPKEYLAKTDKEVTHDHLIAISNGALVEGIFVKPANVTKVRRGTVKVTVTEGKKHEVRILLESAGLQVLELSRIRIGGLHLGALETGKWREISQNERDSIFR